MSTLAQHYDFIDTHSRWVSDIAAPLFSRTDISFFSYGRLYPDGSQIFLSTHPQWYKTWAESGSLSCAMKFSGQGQYLWSDFLQAKEVELLSAFNLNDGLTILRPNKHFIEMFGFNTPKHVNSHKIYLQYIEHMQRFCMYFKEKCFEQNILDNAPASVLHNKSEDRLIKGKNTPQTANEFLSISKVFFNGNQSVMLTKRERECIDLFIRGYSSIESAKIMGISKKTEQTHLKNIKVKFNCTTDIELYKLLWDMGALKADFFPYVYVAAD